MLVMLFFGMLKTAVKKCWIDYKTLFKTLFDRPQVKSLTIDDVGLEKRLRFILARENLEVLKTLETYIKAKTASSYHLLHTFSQESDCDLQELACLMIAEQTEPAANVIDINLGIGKRHPGMGVRLTGIGTLGDAHGLDSIGQNCRRHVFQAGKEFFEPKL